MRKKLKIVVVLLFTCIVSIQAADNVLTRKLLAFELGKTYSGERHTKKLLTKFQSNPEYDDYYSRVRSERSAAYCTYVFSKNYGNIPFAGYNWDGIKITLTKERKLAVVEFVKYHGCEQFDYVADDLKRRYAEIATGRINESSACWTDLKTTISLCVDGEALRLSYSDLDLILRIYKDEKNEL